MNYDTKYAMAEVLKNRLSKTTLKNITVSDITDECGLNRQTFYYHFKDIYDLLEWTFLEEAEKIVSKDNVDEDIKIILKRVFDAIKDNKKIISNACKSTDKFVMNMFLRQWIEPIVGELIDEKAEGKSIYDDDKDFLKLMCSAALIGLISVWIDSGMKDSLYDKTDKFTTLLDGGIEDAIDRFTLEK